MKIWITYNSAFGLQCGGLERVWVWFRQPEWVDRWRTDEETPFGESTDLTGRREIGWVLHGAIYGLRSISFGKMFGYSDSGNEDQDELATYVWGKLCEHFTGYDFREWHNAPICPKDFLLEVDINISRIKK